LFYLFTSWSLKMLSAGLFAALAILQVGLALLESRTTQPSIDVLVHATYFVVGKIQLQILLALASACFALIYFAFSRWTLHPLNNSLGVTHFVMATIGFVLLSMTLSALSSAALAIGLPAGQALNYWPGFALSGGVFCFLLGCAALAVNCTRTAIMVFRSH
jgi:heme/copper-type cytochrome/quinol oxidase subunit 1